MKRKPKHEEHVNHERWLVSYADFITLLFAFFVTLYAISQVDLKKLGKLSESMQTAFDTQVFEPGSSKLSLSEGQSGPSKGPAQQQLVEPIAATVSSTPAMASVQASIRSKLVNTPFIDRVRFVQERRGLVVSLTEAGFFDPGHGEMKETSQAILDAIAESVLAVPNQIRIEGHTDNTPIHTPQFPSNWELSTERATRILAYLTSHYQFNPSKMSVAGYGQYRPVASNDTADGRAMNRRVDLVILSEVAEREEPQ